MFFFSKQRRKVRMHIQDGPSIEGFLEGRTRTEYIVWCPKVLDPDEVGDQAVAVSGHVEIPRERVLYYQVIG